MRWTPSFRLKKLGCQKQKLLAAFVVAFLLILLHSSPSHHKPRSFVDGAQILSYSFSSNIIVSELNRFVFCPVPKAANSNWKYLIRKFEGFNDYSELAKAHHHNTSGLRYLSDYSPLEVQRILTDNAYFKFVFVRNPFRRLLSCYMDKFLNMDSDYVRTEYRTFLANLFSWRHARKVDIYTQPRPSFESFVDELTKQRPARMNAHWMPQVIHCGLGKVPYDFIGRMEHLDEDVKHILKALGRPDEHFPSQDEIGFPASGASKLAISNIYSEEVAAKVRAMYHMDLKLLGYSHCESKRDFLACLTK